MPCERLCFGYIRNKVGREQSGNDKNGTRFEETIVPDLVQVGQSFYKLASSDKNGTRFEELIIRKPNLTSLQVDLEQSGNDKNGTRFEEIIVPDLVQVGQSVYKLASNDKNGTRFEELIIRKPNFTSL